MEFWQHEVGYDKIHGRWGIAIRTLEGNESDPERIKVESWHFNDAPRALRIDAVDKIPALVDQLVKLADETTTRIKERTGTAQQIATAITQAAVELRPQRKQGAKS